MGVEPGVLVWGVGWLAHCWVLRDQGCPGAGCLLVGGGGVGFLGVWASFAGVVSDDAVLGLVGWLFVNWIVDASI